MFYYKTPEKPKIFSQDMFWLNQTESILLPDK